MAYFCYMVRCKDGSFYTGWTIDPERRTRQHNSGRGAAYTRLHRPVELVYVEPQPDRSTAMRRERRIKSMTHSQKDGLAEVYRAKRKKMIKKEPMEPLLIKAEYFAFAPGRVNLLGEHVDYNGGAVLPMAINRWVRIESRGTGNDHIHIKALDLGQEVEFTPASVPLKQDAFGMPLPAWALYPAGVAWVLDRESLTVKGIEAVFASTIPVGAGLSSSAAVEVAFGNLWQTIGGWTVTPLQMAVLCQRAENHYVGVNCGLMDQFASACGVEGSAVWFDTRSQESRAVKLPENTLVVIADSGVRHDLASSAYNERRASCEEALHYFQAKMPGVTCLREITIDDFKQYSSGLGKIPRKRAGYIIHECARMDAVEEILSRNDAAGFGRLMNETHAGLRDDYEVSCPELDSLAETAWNQPGCFGSRMTGAGFGGCTVSLVAQSAGDDFVSGLKQGYLQKTGRKAEVYICEAVGGAEAGRF